MMTITPHTKVRRNEELLATSVDGELILLSIEAGKYFGINQVGHHIWKLLEHPTRVSELCTDLSEAFQTPLQQCEQDVLPFLQHLAQKGLLIIAD